MCKPSIFILIYHVLHYYPKQKALNQIQFYRMTDKSKQCRVTRRGGKDGRCGQQHDLCDIPCLRDVSDEEGEVLDDPAAILYYSSSYMYLSWADFTKHLGTQDTLTCLRDYIIKMSLFSHSEQGKLSDQQSSRWNHHILISVPLNVLKQIQTVQ